MLKIDRILSEFENESVKSPRLKWHRPKPDRLTSCECVWLTDPPFIETALRVKGATLTATALAPGVIAAQRRDQVDRTWKTNRT